MESRRAAHHRILNPACPEESLESQVSLLVGGDYDGPAAKGIDGTIVVLGDFNVGEEGLDTLGKHHTIISVFFSWFVSKSSSD